MKISVEKLTHFQCEYEACKKWWSIADAPTNKIWACPWCHKTQSMTIMDLTPRQVT